MSDSLTQSCPTCAGTTLDTLTLSRGRIERCPSCQAFLIPDETLLEYSDDRAKMAAALAETAALRLPTTRSCPKCLQYLHNARVRSRSVTLTLCPMCKAIWFDPATLAKFDESLEVRLRGEIERALHPDPAMPLGGWPTGNGASASAPRAYPPPPAVDDKGIAAVVRGVARQFDRLADRLGGREEAESIRPAPVRTAPPATPAPVPAASTAPAAPAPAAPSPAKAPEPAPPKPPVVIAASAPAVAPPPAPPVVEIPVVEPVSFPKEPPKEVPPVSTAAPPVFEPVDVIEPSTPSLPKAAPAPAPLPPDLVERPVVAPSARETPPPPAPVVKAPAPVMPPVLTPEPEVEPSPIAPAVAAPLEVPPAPRPAPEPPAKKAPPKVIDLPVSTAPKKGLLSRMNDLFKPKAAPSASVPPAPSSPFKAVTPEPEGKKTKKKPAAPPVDFLAEALRTREEAQAVPAVEPEATTPLPPPIEERVLPVPEPPVVPPAAVEPPPPAPVIEPPSVAAPQPAPVAAPKPVSRIQMPPKPAPVEMPATPTPVTEPAKRLPEEALPVSQPVLEPVTPPPAAAPPPPAPDLKPAIAATRARSDDKVARFAPWVMPVGAVVLSSFQDYGFEVVSAIEWGVIAWCIGWMVRLFYRFPFGAAPERSVTDLTQSPLSGCRGVPVTLRGTVVADGNGFALQDDGGRVALNQAFALDMVGRLFGVAGLSSFVNHPVRVSGWWLGSKTPSIELQEIADDKKSRKSMARGVRWAGVIAVMFLTLVILWSTQI